MEVNNKVIREGILGEFKKGEKPTGGPHLDGYLEQFPHIAKEINDVVESPSCSICARALMKGILDTEDFQNRLETVYGEPVTGRIAYQTQ